MKDSSSSIEIREVSKKFGRVTALDKVSFSVKPGELFFVLGPSGCGKTTILRILAGLETPDSGEIFFHGKNIASLPPYRRGAPMVFQNYALWPHLSVYDNIAFGLVERKVPKKEIRTRTEETLRRVGMENLSTRMPGQLSGGQQQRVVLARALVLNPDIMLLDEPLSNLDAKLRGEMRDEIEKLHRETSITFIYVTHDQTEALSLADRLVVMQNGKISAIGTPFELYHRPANKFCADFLGEANLLPGRISGKNGELLIVETSLGSWLAVNSVNSKFAEGTLVECLIRPENIRPYHPGRDTNKFEAVVRSIRLNGSTVTAVLQAGGITLMATLLNEYAVNLKIGKTTQWYVAPENMVAIAEA
ncbi:MAG: ABC transporter ATP-binding protein [Kiritimatiellae bacterium]|nr:ABC transporter ATP-binding protein [Kiritimatiellia bacterium]MDD5520464.1 ABC transporter ATP-binding protein [Kiritimatiellia bacterium]